MRFIKVEYSNNYPADDTIEFHVFPDSMSDRDITIQLEESLGEWAGDNCAGSEGYSYDEGWESDEAEDDYYDNCSVFWEPITQEEYEDEFGTVENTEV